MADSNIREIDLRWWIAESQHLGQRWDFSNVEWLDNEVDVSGIKLWPLVETFSTTQVWYGDLVAYVSDDSNLWYFTNAWGTNWFGSAYLNGVYVPWADPSASAIWPLINAIKYGDDRIILIRRSWLDILDLTTNTTTNSATSNYLSDWLLRPALVFSGNLYFGNGRYVMMTNDTILLAVNTMITTQKSEEIVFLSGYIDQIKFYGRIDGNTIQYVWDSISDTRNYSNPWKWQVILNWFQIWGLDYIWFGDGIGSLRAIYLFQGTQWQELFRNYANNYIFWQINYGNEAATGTGYKFFCTWTDLNWNNVVFKHFYNKVTGKMSIGTICTLPDIIDSVYFHDNFLYFTHNGNQNDIYRVWVQNVWNLNQTAPSGNVETLNYGVENGMYLKKIKEIRYLYEKSSSNSWSQIRLYARDNGQGAYTLIDTIDSLNTVVQKLTYANNLPSGYTNQFYTIQFKVEIVRPNGNLTANNILRKLIVLYEIIER